MGVLRYRRLLDKIVRWLLLIIIIIYLLTGYGITEFRIVEDITFGLITKPLAFKIHQVLIFPFAALVLLHIALPSILRYARLK